FGSSAARAEDPPLLELLRQKHVLTQEEVNRVKGAELTPAQRAGLIEVLRAKGVLTEDEARKLTAPPAAPVTVEATPGAPPPQVAAAPPPAPAQLGYDEGFFVRSADGNFSLRFNGRVATNFLFFEPGTVQSDTETIDRARLSI